MGGRLSVPRGPGGMTEASQVPATTTASRSRPRLRLNSRVVVGPVAAVLLGTIFYVYSNTSIAAAKENAKRTREADGGSISWRNESRRRHGMLEKPEQRTLWEQLFAGKEDPSQEKARIAEGQRGRARSKDINPIEEGIRRARERSNNSDNK